MVWLNLTTNLCHVCHLYYWATMIFFPNERDLNFPKNDYCFSSRKPRIATVRSNAVVAAAVVVAQLVIAVSAVEMIAAEANCLTILKTCFSYSDVFF